MPIDTLSHINLNTSEGLQWLTYRSLEERDVIHGSFLRKGGFSKGAYSSLNLATNVGDKPEDVQKNRQALCQSLSINNLVFADQVHGTSVSIINEPPTTTPKCDILITSSPNIALAIKHADCQAAIFYDPEHHVLAAVHAGWKGLSDNIYKKTIQTLEKKFETKPNALICTISPSIGPCHMEFKGYKDSFPESMWNYADDKSHMNLWLLAYDQLIASGLESEHIALTELCTYEHEELFFSYRRNKECGRMVTVAMLPR